MLVLNQAYKKVANKNLVLLVAWWLEPHAAKVCCRGKLQYPFRRRGRDLKDSGFKPSLQKSPLITWHSMRLGALNKT